MVTVCGVRVWLQQHVHVVFRQYLTISCIYRETVGISWFEFELSQLLLLRLLASERANTCMLRPSITVWLRLVVQQKASSPTQLPPLRIYQTNFLL